MGMMPHPERASDTDLIQMVFHQMQLLFLNPN